MRNFNMIRILIAMFFVGPLALNAQIPNLLGNGSSTFDNSNPCRISVTFDYTNDGFAPATGFTSGLYLTTDQFAADPDFDILAREVTNAQGCQVGQNRTLTFSNIDISGLVVSGQLYYVYVFLDSYDDINEMDEDDNLSFVGSTNCNLVGIIQPNLSQTQLSVGPNPTSNLLSIQVTQPGVKQFDLEVYDALGRQAYSRKGIDCGFADYSLQLSVDTWASGLYWVKIVSEEFQLSQKVVVE